MAKIWYEVIAKCVDNKNCDVNCNIGDEEVLAKVKSKGLANITKQVFEKVYGDSFKITIA